MQNDLASALARSGREEEALATVDSAEAAARDVKNDALTADILNTRGDIELYRGNLSAAGQQFQKAMQSAVRSKDQGLIALTRMNLARVALAQGHARETVTMLLPLIDKRTSFDKRLGIRISTTLSEALLQTHALPRARQTLLGDLGAAEKAGMKPEIGRIYYLLAAIARPAIAAETPPATAVKLSNRSTPSATNRVETRSCSAPTSHRCIRQAPRWLHPASGPKRNLGKHKPAVQATVLPADCRLYRA